jgi:hypothetical protein
MKVHSICNPFLTVSCSKDHLKSRGLTILCLFLSTGYLWKYFGQNFE